MTDRKPTPNQLVALAAIRNGQVKMIDCGGVYRIDCSVHPSVVGRCISLGWAKWPKGPFGVQVCELTAAGQILAARTK